MSGIGPEYGQARSGDLSTAHEAAEKVRPGSDRRVLLEAHSRQPGGLTDEEAYAEASPRPGIEYATRCSELVRYGLLENTAAERVGRSGMRRIVRKITPQGYLALGVIPPDLIRVERPGKPDQYISRRRAMADSEDARRVRMSAVSPDLSPLIPRPVPRFGSPFCDKCRGYGGTVAERCHTCGGSGYRL